MYKVRSVHKLDKHKSVKVTKSYNYLLFRSLFNK